MLRKLACVASAIDLLLHRNFFYIRRLRWSGVKFDSGIATAVCTFGFCKGTLKRLFILWIFLGLMVQVDAQSVSGLKSKKVSITSDTIFLDSTLIVPHSLHIPAADSNRYELDESRHFLLWRGGDYPQDSLTVYYRTLPHFLIRTYTNKSRDLIDAYYRENPFGYVPKSERYLTTSSDEIKTLGNISRGIGFGNRQDLVVNSNLNLRLSGTIQNEVEILAAISDENNPIQPEGNTQQIQEFDRVFVQMRKDSTALTAGDFQMTTPVGSYFMKYNKKSRGLQIQHADTVGNGHFQVSGEGAVSRGRFSRNEIVGIEGNQGPYRLNGTNGEIFIIIISGTEQVYLDGSLLTRGEQNDYVIDYNSGELTFMPSRLITRYSRIVVEFQYSDRNYGRSVVRTGAAYTEGRWRIRANYFSEQDNKNQPFQVNLDLFDSIGMQSARQILALSGDNEFAYLPRIDSLSAHSPSIIQYYRKDSLGFEVYVYAPKAETGRNYYQLGFSFVGQGNGNYVQLLSDANGKVFQWVAPVNGVPTGNSEPVEILVAPRRLQMFNVGLDYQLGKNTISSVELVRTTNDLNTFSALDEHDDIGYGFRYDLTHAAPLSRSGTGLWKMESRLSYEHTQKNFQYIERYRDVEFQRSWNRTLDNPSNAVANYNEHIATADIVLTRGKSLWLRSRQSFYDRGGDFGGYAQSYQGKWSKNRNTAIGGADYVNSTLPWQGGSMDNLFLRYGGEYRRQGKWASSGFSWYREESGFGQKGDTLLPQSYQYEERRIDLSNGDSVGLNWRLLLNQRLDFLGGKEGRYDPATDGRDASFQMGWRNKQTAVNLTGTYRLLQFSDTQFQDESTTQGRVEIRQDFLQKVVRTTTYYQVGTGQDQRREYSYLEVGDGNGAYVWNDYDSNGIQSLSEFELASEFDIGRANFIRQFLPVQGFIKSYTSELNHNFRITPAAVWRGQDPGMKKFVARFSNNSAVKIQKKVLDNDPDLFLNPFILEIADSLMLTTNAVLRSVFSFNQASPIFGIDYQWYRLDNRQLLVNGVDVRTNRENKIKIRYNIRRSWEINVSSTEGNKSYVSAFLTGRSYQYEFQSVRPQLGFQYKRNLRLEVYYDYFQAKNGSSYGSEKTFNHDYTAELRLNYLNQGTVRTSVGVVNINYLGNDNSPVAYELLNGLKNGRNAKWSLQVEQRFSNSIQLLVTYDGRRSLNSPVIHIGRLQARYLF